MTGCEVGVVVSGSVVDDDDVDGVTDVTDGSVMFTATLSFPFPKNLVGISMIFDGFFLLESLLNPASADRMSARPRLFSDTNPTPCL